MKKALFFAVIAFLVSASATTGVMVKLHQPEPDSTAIRSETAAAGGADSAQAVAVADSLAVDTSRTDTITATGPNGPSGASAAAAATAGTLASSTAVPPRRPAAPPQDPAANAAAYKQVARVLAAMKPPQAAKVLSQLSDDEVEGILRAVGPRQAADFLTNLSTERAGVLSRRLLVPREKDQTR